MIDNKVLFFAHMRAAWECFLKLPLGRIIWYTVIFALSGGMIIPIYGLVWTIRKAIFKKKLKELSKRLAELAKNLRKMSEKSQDLGKNP